MLFLTSLTNKYFLFQLPEHALLCVDCWARAQEYVQIAEGNVVQPRTPSSTLSLADDYRHAPNNNNHCFVPSCTNTERLRVPDYRYKKKDFAVTKNICNRK